VEPAQVLSAAGEEERLRGRRGPSAADRRGREHRQGERRQRSRRRPGTGGGAGRTRAPFCTGQSERRRGCDDGAIHDSFHARLTRIVVIAVLLGAGASRADDTGLSQGIAYGLAGIAAGIFDTAFTIYDVAKLSQGQPGNRYAGVVEVLGAAPQIVVASIVMANPPPWDPAGR